MSKTIMGLFLVVNLHAESYEELLERAINNNTNLQLMQNRQEQVSLEGAIDIRYKNPNVELEMADFSTQRIFSNKAFGGRMGVSQSLLLPHIKREKKSLTLNKLDVAKENYSVFESDFIYNFNLQYLAYKRARKLLEFQEKAIELSAEILEVARQRYAVGAIAKSEFLQAKLDHSKGLSRVKSFAFKTIQAKNALFRFANIESEGALDEEHFFMQKGEQNLHPLIRLNQAKEQVSRAKIKLLGHSLQSVEVFSELEREPEQDIFRVGFSIALPTFNLRKEEKQLEKIKIANQQLLIGNQERAIDLQTEQLKAEQSALESLIQNDELLIEEQEMLFDMYRQSYILAKVNLLKLQRTKRYLLETKERILENRFTLEQNNIKINYLQGAYSD